MLLRLSIFNDILFGTLAPWRPENTNEDKFKNILDNQVRKHKDNPVKFFHALTISLKAWSINLKIDNLPEAEKLPKFAYKQIDQESFNFLTIPDFYDKATEFYYYLIQNEHQKILSEFAYNVSKAKNNVTAKYQVSSVLKKIEYYMVQIRGKNISDNLSAFVLEALSISLFRLYEEIKVMFPELLGPDTLTETDIISLIAPDYEINKNDENGISGKINRYFQNRNTKNTIKVSEPDILFSSGRQTEKPHFIQRKCDFNDGFKGKLSYDEVVNKELFALFESHLYNNGFIDIDYHFTNKHSLKKELAAIYHILIQKKYFRERNFKHQSKFRNADYRQYLDNRYFVDTSQQFRRTTPNYIKTISNKYFWLDTLQSCH